MKFFYWLSHTLVGGLFKLFYRHRTYGFENIIPGAAILAPNHASFFDPPLVAISCPEEIHFLARKSLFIPGFGYLIKSLNAHPISGNAQDIGSFKLIGQLLQNGNKVIIFPEGTRTFDGNLMSIKSGLGMLALRNKAPIIPVYVHGTYEVWSRARKLPKPYGKTACVFGKPIYPQEFEHLDKREAHEAIGQAVSKSIEQLKEWYIKK